MLLRLYHLIPVPIRLFLYRQLLPIGEYLYGKGTYGVFCVQRLPFNLYLKRARYTRLQYEASALNLVARHTALNAPRVLDFIKPTAGEESWLLTTRLEGDIAGKCLLLMNADQIEQFKIDFRDYVEQIRTIPNPYPHPICGVLGGGCQDCRIDKETGGTGPYDRIEDLNKHLMAICSPIPSPSDRAIVAEIQSRSYRIFFTHADLNPGNVIIHNGRLSGFVDWEFAGWYPEYWEYTKACYIVHRWTLRLEVLGDVFPKYAEELKAERVFQNYTCPF
jgi:hypothetical protein